MSTKSKRSSKKRKAVKQRDPSWQLRHALGHKVEPNPKAYTRKLKHPEDIDPEIAPWHPLCGDRIGDRMVLTLVYKRWLLCLDVESQTTVESSDSSNLGWITESLQKVIEKLRFYVNMTFTPWMSAVRARHRPPLFFSHNTTVFKVLASADLDARYREKALRCHLVAVMKRAVTSTVQKTTKQDVYIGDYKSPKIDRSS